MFGFSLHPEQEVSLPLLKRAEENLKVSYLRRKSISHIARVEMAFSFGTMTHY